MNILEMRLACELMKEFELSNLEFTDTSFKATRAVKHQNEVSLSAEEQFLSNVVAEARAQYPEDLSAEEELEDEDPVHSWAIHGDLENEINPPSDEE